MEKIKIFIVKHFEEIIVISILLSTMAINLFTVHKIAFLQFYYLPVLVSGFFLGRRMAVLLAFLSILVVVLFMVFYPNFCLQMIVSIGGKSNVIFNLVIWGSFLLLTAAIVGKLYEEKEKKIRDLHNAYIGILEILSKYLESADKYTQGHSIRVSRLSTDIAIAMELPRNEIENIKAAALLHDIGKIDISLDIIHKASELSKEEREIINTHPEKGVKIVASVGGILKEAIPLIMAHHEYFMSQNKSEGERKDAKTIPLGARIIAVADAYDAMITDRPYRKGKTPREAAEIVEKASGSQFDPVVVEAFLRVISSELEQD
ncbi:MAG: HD domain-containing protein [Candidatus Omnitrophica bacterium]|nr:HD domain-containing protein [Candidatus Omnitrophota bacterium]